MSSSNPLVAAIGAVGLVPATLRLAEIDVSWAVLAIGLCFLSLYMRGVSNRSYPRWTWMIYLAAGGVIFIAVSLRPLWPVQYHPHLRYTVMAMLIIFAAGFYVLASAEADRIEDNEDGDEAGTTRDDTPDRRQALRELDHSDPGDDDDDGR